MAWKKDKSPEELDPLLKRDKTTMPAISGPPDPARPPEGPPGDYFAEKVQKSAQPDPEAEKMHLLGPVSEQQLKEDQSQWFTEAPQYADRTATMTDAVEDKIKLPFSGSSLRKRAKRVDDMAIYLDHERRRLGAIEASMIVERADLMRLCDIAVTEAELYSRRPTLPEEERKVMLKVADIPLSVWRKRQQRIQARRDENERARAALDEAHEATQEAIDRLPEGDSRSTRR